MIEIIKNTINNQGLKILAAGVLSTLALSGCASDKYKEAQAVFAVTCPEGSPELVAVKGRFHQNVYVYCKDQDSTNDTKERLAKPLSVEPADETRGDFHDNPNAQLLHVNFSYPIRNNMPTAEEAIYNPHFHSELVIKGANTIIDVGVGE